MKESILASHKVILFDGVCNLCNGAVNFVIKRDKNDIFRFAALQSEVGKKLLNQFQIDPIKTDSIILIDNNKAYIKSAAALRIARRLNAAYPLLYGFVIVPKLVSDRIYDFIAARRYKWFGKKEFCMIPTKELQAKFLE